MLFFGILKTKGIKAIQSIQKNKSDNHIILFNTSSRLFSKIYDTLFIINENFKKIFFIFTTDNDNKHS